MVCVAAVGIMVSVIARVRKMARRRCFVFIFCPFVFTVLFYNPNVFFIVEIDCVHYNDVDIININILPQILPVVNSYFEVFCEKFSTYAHAKKRTLKGTLKIKKRLNMKFHLREIRESKGFSIEELAKMANVAKGAIVQIESGDANPTLKTMHKLSRALLVNVWDLVEFD